MGWAIRTVAAVAVVVAAGGPASTAWAAAEEPSFNPFGQRKVGVREDAIPGAIYYSDGRILVGDLYLTRDKKLRGFMEKEGQHHWIALKDVQSITAVIVEQRKEKHWRWVENANDAKLFTGLYYPMRIYEYDVLYADKKKVRFKQLYNPIYVRESPEKKPVRLILHHRDKGKLQAGFDTLEYIKRIELGKDAKERAQKAVEAQKRAAEKKAVKEKAKEEEKAKAESGTETPPEKGEKEEKTPTPPKTDSE